jgi:hypothetical protein
MEQQSNSQPNNFNPPPIYHNNGGSGGTHQVLGIIGLVLGVLALILSFVPCIGMWAIAPGIIGLILSAVGMSMAGKVGASKGLSIAGLVLSIIACLMAAYWYWVVMRVPNELKDAGIRFDSIVDQFDTAKLNDLKNMNINITDSTGNVSIKTDSGEINININGKK